MQQTETYQLNKIDVDDNFSPAPLNENMDKVDAKLAVLDQAAAALDSRVTALEDHQVAMGEYLGTAALLTVPVGFTPIFVMVWLNRGGIPFIATTDQPSIDTLSVVDGGFQLSGKSGNNANQSGKRFYYLAVR